MSHNSSPTSLPLGLLSHQRDRNDFRQIRRTNSSVLFTGFAFTQRPPVEPRVVSWTDTVASFLVRSFYALQWPTLALSASSPAVYSAKYSARNQVSSSRLPGPYLPLSWLAQQFSQFFQAAEEQSDHGRAGASHLLGHLGHWKALQVMQLDHPPLIFRQPGQGGGKSQQFLAANGSLARRSLVGGEQALQPRRQFEVARQGALPTDVPCPRLEPTGGRGQNVRQDGPEPGQLLGLGCATELPLGFVGLQNRLLDDVGGIQLRLEAGA
jgi:hypothetical protein